MSRDELKIEVSGNRYVKFDGVELHVADEYGEMETEPSIVQVREESVRGVRTAALKDKYSMIDLHANSPLGSSNFTVINNEFMGILREYNRVTYNKNTPLLLIDSTEYRYYTDRKADGQFQLDDSYIRAIIRKRRGLHNYSKEIIPNYPNIWKDAGKICEGRAGITGNVPTVASGLKRMVHEFFITVFNTDLCSATRDMDLRMPRELYSYYIERRSEQLGLDDNQEHYLRRWVDEKLDNMSSAYDTLAFYAVLGVDYTNVYN